MDNDVVILTACDQRYFPYCVDLLMSIQKAMGALPRIRVLDVGMLPGQAAALAGIVEKVIEPDWDVGADMGLKPWYRAMTARPFLPRYAENAAILVWMDSDTWVQRFAPLAALIRSARDGALAIVEEKFGSGFTATLWPDHGGTLSGVNTDSVKAYIRDCCEKCFGQETADAFGDLPCFNNGVFALRTDSPSWAVWQELYAPALKQHFHLMSEQMALNVGIRRGRIPISRQSQEANYTCHLELPWYSAKQGVFTIPGDEDRVIGTVHLCETKNYRSLPIPQFPDGEIRQMPLDCRRVEQFAKTGSLSNTE